MKIAHLADIHIQFASRFEEYEKVFSNLYEDLKNRNIDRIVVAGDLHHVKGKLSSRSMYMLYDFLYNLSLIAPTDIILGNHDISSIKSKEDIISPLFLVAKKVDKEKKLSFYFVNKTNKNEIDFSKKGVYLYYDSDIYKINETIRYGVFSLIDQENYPVNFEREKDKIYIALYHAPIKNSSTDIGYVFEEGNINSIDIFNNYDLAFLGDIHKHQSFRNNTIAYSGSLIQQDISESVEKGYLLWDIKQKNFEFIKVYNEHAFIRDKINIKEWNENEIIHFLNKIIDKINKNKIVYPKIYIDINYPVSVDSNKVEIFIKDYINKNLFVSYELKINHEVTYIEKKSTEINISTNNYFNILKDYILDRYSVDNEFLEKVLEYAYNVDNVLALSNELKQKSNWYIEKIVFSNLLSFDDQEYEIDFNTLNGATLIYGKNYSGKSNIIKILIFALFGKGFDGVNLRDIVNIYTPNNTGYTKIYLNINNKRYCIKRTIENINANNKKKMSSNVEFEYYDEKEGDYIPVPINDVKTKFNIEETIYNEIGDYDNFIRLYIQSVTSKTNFIDSTTGDKNGLIYSALGIDLLTKRREYVKENLKELKKEISQYDSLKNLVDNKHLIEQELKTKKTTLEELKKEVTQLENIIKKTDEEYKELLKKKIPVFKFESWEYDDINIINKKIEELNLNLEEIESEIKSIQTWLNENPKIDLGELNNIDINSLSNEIEILENQIENSSLEIRNNEKQISELENTLLNIEKQIGKDKLEKNKENYEDVIQDYILKTNNEIAELKNKEKLYLLGKCPTCNREWDQKEMEDLKNIQNKITTLLQNLNVAKERKNIYSQYYSKQKELENLIEKNKVKAEKIDNFKKQIQYKKELKNKIEQKYDVIIKNKEFDDKTKIMYKKLEEKQNTIKKLNLYEENKRKIIKNIEINEKNKEIDEKIKQIETTLETIKYEYKEKNSLSNKIETEIILKEKELKDIEHTIDKINEINEKHKIVSFYNQIIDKDELPSYILNFYLPQLTKDINKLLEEIVDFNIEINTDDSGNIVEYIYYEHGKKIPLSQASASQKFISNIVIKESLRNLVTNYDSQITIIDEGFGTLDTELLYKIGNIIEFLKKRYKNILIISHIDAIADKCNNVIHIERHNNFSSLSINN